jgi:photosystem II stability/assembly factor-like uncharacterized protein
MLRIGILAVAVSLVAGGAARAAVPSPAPLPVPAAIASVSPKPTASPSPSPTAKPPYKSMEWRELGPALPGGRVANVAGSAKNPNLYYAGSAGGGVWKSTDGGETWNAVFEKQDVASIGDVVIDPTNDQVVWVGTGEANPRNDVIPGDGIYKSTDGGATWTHLGLEKTRSISRIIVDPRNPDHVIVGALGDVFGPSDARGVYVTNDGGKTWSKTLYLSDQSGASDLSMDAHDSNIIFAGMWHFLRRPWTTNSGGDDDGLYKSIDGGKTWTKLTGHGLPGGTIGRIGVAVAPSDPKRVYALIESTAGILWRSDDGGDTWMMVTKDTLVNNRPFYFSHVVVDPSNANHVYGLSVVASFSKDGGKTFRPLFPPSHGDYHGMWIAPNDHTRIIVAEDGGVARSVDGGGTWFFGRNLPVGEVYHVGVGAIGNPYWVCGGWQDNNAWCGPAFSTDPSGVLNKHWIDATGGDGEWAIPDPADKDWLWADSQQGSLSVYNKRTRDTIPAQPYFATTEEQFNLSSAGYRFNWDSPIAFAPWNPHIAWLGGNVVFQTADRGRHWTRISPDLTLNEKSHQQPPGGPITHDVSSAENYNTILDIEGSTLHGGEIWVGTDDGQVQVTLDGGKHWKNVSPAGVPDHGAVETVAPSRINDGTVYASIDRHVMGDYKPYLFVTHNFGQSWTRITGGLPDNQYARSIRPDLRNRSIVYAGTETGMWISCDGGGSWHDFKNNLPTVSVRDIRFQSTWDDMVIATHGRALYIMDDMRPLQAAACSKPDAPFVLAPRDTYIYNQHGDDEGNYTDYAAANPPIGNVVVWFYLPVQGKEAPAIRFYDARGKLVRTVSGTHRIPFGPSKDIPWIRNAAGLQKYAWDLSTDGPVKWNGAGDFFKGPDEGISVPPGRYTLRLTLAGKTYRQGFDIKPDPDSVFTQADYETAYAFSKRFQNEFSTIDTALNNLDDVKAALDKARTAASGKNDAATLKAIDDSIAARQTLQDSLSANYIGFEDFTQRSGRLREDLQGLMGAPLITPAIRSVGDKVDRAYTQRIGEYSAYIASLGSLNATLKKAGLTQVVIPKAVRT